MAPTTSASEVLEFVVVVGALQLSYLIWGVMQESIMHCVICDDVSTMLTYFPFMCTCHRVPTNTAHAIWHVPECYVLRL